jgi:hypothetical protein
MESTLKPPSRYCTRASFCRVFSAWTTFAPPVWHAAVQGNSQAGETDMKSKSAHMCACLTPRHPDRCNIHDSPSHAACHDLIKRVGRQFLAIIEGSIVLVKKVESRHSYGTNMGPSHDCKKFSVLKSLTGLTDEAALQCVGATLFAQTTLPMSESIEMLTP